MSIAKNKGLWLGAGALGCLGMVMVAGFIVVGGIALYAMSDGPTAAPVQPQGYRPDDGGATPPVEEGALSETVILEGQIVDAATGEAVPGGIFMLLTPGRTIADFYASGDPNGDGIIEMMSMADGEGWFRMNGVRRGYTYTMASGAPGYRDLSQDHGLVVDNAFAEAIRFDPIRLQRQ